MKRVYSGWAVLALVLAATACSGADGESSPGHEPSTPASSNASEPTTSVPAAPAAATPATPNTPAGEATPTAANNGSVDTPANVPSAPAATPANAAPTPSAPALENSILGTITDLGTGNPADGLGGVGTLANAVKVRLSQLVGGTLSVLGETNVGPNGTYSLGIPAQAGTLVAEALDAVGNVLGAVVIDNVAANVVAPPMTSETSLEAAIVLSAASCPGAVFPVDSQIDLSLVQGVLGLIDSDLTKAITSAIAGGVDPAHLVEALVNAVTAAVHAQTGVLSTVNVTVAGDPAHVRAQVAARLAFTSTLANSLANVAQADKIVFAAVHAAAQIEAKLTADAVKQIIVVAGASQDLVDQATAVGNALLAAVAKATNIPALQQAQLDFVSDLLGSVNGGTKGGLIGTLLTQTTGTVNSLLGSVLGQVETLANNLDANLGNNMAGMGATDVCIDVNAAAKLDLNLQSVSGSLTQFVADVAALGPDLLKGGNGKLPLTALTDLLTTAQVLLRGLLP